jgi:hypothetical protein
MNTTIKNFYDKLDKCRKHRCDSFKDGRCIIINRSTNELCANSLYKRIYELNQENIKYKSLLTDLILRLNRVESNFDTMVEVVNKLD